MFVADIVARRGEGAGAYILSVLDGLKSAGFAIEYVCTRSPGKRVPWCRIDPALREVATPTIAQGGVVGRTYLRPWPLTDWIVGPAETVYRALPDAWKRARRGVRARESGTNQAAMNATRVMADRELEFCKRRFMESPPRVVIANRAWMAASLELAPRGAVKVILTHDVYSNRLATFAKQGVAALYAGMDREKEARELGKADVIVAIQEEEAEELRAMAPRAEVVTVPIAAEVREATGRAVAGRCLLVASDEAHNRHGLQWLLDEVWPRVRAETPAARLHVCGDVCRNHRSAPEGVELRGFVADLDAEYAEAEVCVIPLLAGSGLKIKLVDALAHGRACVATSVGIQGMKELKGKAVFVADDAASFAEAIGTLVRDATRRSSMETAATAYVRERLSSAMVNRPLVETIARRLAP